MNVSILIQHNSISCTNKKNEICQSRDSHSVRDLAGTILDLNVQQLGGRRDTSRSDKRGKSIMLGRFESRIHNRLSIAVLNAFTVIFANEINTNSRQIME